MKAVFIHDFPVFKKDRNYYSYRGFQSYVWDRYLTHIDTINVICRLLPPLSVVNEKQRADRNEVKFYPQENYSSFKNIKLRNKALNTMEEVIKNSDLIILRLPSILGIDAYKYVKKYNKPYIVEVVGNGYKSLWLTGKLIGKVLSPYMHIKMKKIIIEANGSIYVTDKYLQDIYPTSGLSTSISNVNMKYVIYEKEAVDRKLIDQKTLNIGLIGTENIKYKNFLGGIRFLKEYFSNSDMEIKISIAGGGEINHTIDKYLKFSSNIIVERVGKLNGKIEVNNWFKSLDLLLHPSLTEGLPRGIIEAVENNVPVIASDAGGSSEIIEHEYIFNPKNLNSFTSAMDNLLNNDINKILSGNNIKIKKYDHELLQNKRDNFLKEVIERNF